MFNFSVDEGFTLHIGVLQVGAQFGKLHLKKHPKEAQTDWFWGFEGL